MKTSYFSIQRQYEIRCKLFAPENETISNVIVGVHGFAGDKESSMLDKLAEKACACRTALLCFDFPAHGDSPVEEEQLTVENCKKDLCAVVDFAAEAYPEARRSIFATSFGGYISLLCAHKLGQIPLVLRAPAVTMPKVLLENVLQITAEEFRQRKTAKCGFERPIQLPYGFYEELSREEDLFQKELAVPILLIHGDCDDVVPSVDVEAFAVAHGSVSLQILQGADHRFKKPGEIETIVKLTKAFLGI